MKGLCDGKARVSTTGARSWLRLGQGFAALPGSGSSKWVGGKDHLRMTSSRIPQMKSVQCSLCKPSRHPEGVENF